MKNILMMQKTVALFAGIIASVMLTGCATTSPSWYQQKLEAEVASLLQKRSLSPFDRLLSEPPATSPWHAHAHQCARDVKPYAAEYKAAMNLSFDTPMRGSQKCDQFVSKLRQTTTSVNLEWDITMVAMSWALYDPIETDAIEKAMTNTCIAMLVDPGLQERGGPAMSKQFLSQQLRGLRVSERPSLVAKGLHQDPTVFTGLTIAGICLAQNDPKEAWWQWWRRQYAALERQIRSTPAPPPASPGGVTHGAPQGASAR